MRTFHSTDLENYNAHVLSGSRIRYPSSLATFTSEDRTLWLIGYESHLKSKSDSSILKDQITENILLLDTVRQEILTLCTIRISRQVLALQQTPVHHMLTPILGTIAALANKKNTIFVLFFNTNAKNTHAWYNIMLHMSPFKRFSGQKLAPQFS